MLDPQWTITLLIAFIGFAVTPAALDWSEMADDEDDNSVASCLRAIMLPSVMIALLGIMWAVVPEHDARAMAGPVGMLLSIGVREALSIRQRIRDMRALSSSTNEPE